LLVAGPAGEHFEGVISMLRADGHYVVPANGEAAALDALHAPHFQFTGLVVLSTAENSDETALCQRVRAQKLPLKTVLSLLSGNQDELDQTILRSVDLVVPFDVAPQEFLERVRTLLTS
jgi:hypothetical protein